MKLYTRTGDDGTTSLFDGTRVAKNHVRVAGYGDVDELNAAIGMVISAIRDLRGDAGKLAEMDQQLAEVQSELFVVGSDLATPGDAKVRAKVPTVTGVQVARLEAWIDAATEPVPALRNFILPGGTEVACRLHQARTIARRAERSVITLSQQEAIGDFVIPYLNRLNDLLFAWARLANHTAGVQDIPWMPRGNPS